jgi:hypothetical protein
MLSGYRGGRLVLIGAAAGIMLGGLGCAQPRLAQTTPQPPAIAPHRHSATLAWNPPRGGKNPHPVTHYYIYRSNAVRTPSGEADCGSGYTRIASVEAPTTSYTDESVEAGHVYCYKVTAAISAVEGPASSSVVAAIPADNPQ